MTSEAPPAPSTSVWRSLGVAYLLVLGALVARQQGVRLLTTARGICLALHQSVGAPANEQLSRRSEQRGGRLVRSDQNTPIIQQ